MAVLINEVFQNSAFKEQQFNMINKALSPAAIFGMRNDLTNAAGLVYSYYGGDYADDEGKFFKINDGSVTCAINQTNYLEYNSLTKLVSLNQTGFSNGNVPLCKLITNENQITSIEDARVLILAKKGVPAGGGGSDELMKFGDIKFTSKTINNVAFSINATEFFNISKKVSSSSQTTTQQYNSSSDFSTFSSYANYYVFFNMFTRRFKTYKSTDTISEVNLKLCYILRTNATEVEYVIDYRSENIYLKNNTYIYVNNITTTTRSIQINVNNLSNLTSDSSQVENTSNYPSFTNVQTLLIAKNAVLGYDVGEELSYITGSAGTYGTPFSIRLPYSQVLVYFDDEIKVLNKTTQKYENINVSDFVSVVKVTLEIR